MADVLSFRVLGEKHVKLVLRIEGRAEPLNAIHFNGWDGEPPAGRIIVVYKLEPDDYRGGDAIQLNIVHREPYTAERYSSLIATPEMPQTVGLKGS